MLGWRRQPLHVEHFEPEAGDPLQQPGKCSLVGQLGTKGGRARTRGDLAVVEFRAQRGARRTRERDLIYL